MKRSTRALLAYEIGGIIFFLSVYFLLQLRGSSYAFVFALYPFLIFQILLSLSHFVGIYLERRKESLEGREEADTQIGGLRVATLFRAVIRHCLRLLSITLPPGTQSRSFMR
jgi:hypothetical protein